MAVDYSTPGASGGVMPAGTHAYVEFTDVDPAFRELAPGDPVSITMNGSVHAVKENCVIISSTDVTMNEAPEAPMEEGDETAVPEEESPAVAAVAYRRPAA